MFHHPMRRSLRLVCQKTTSLNRVSSTSLSCFSTKSSDEVKKALEEVRKISVPSLYDEFDTDNTLCISLVGRPNVGKSTLYNRLTGTRNAIVSPIPGTTRDRREGRGLLAGLPLRVIDTGGLDDRGVVSTSIQAQVEAALAESQVALFMVDARAGVTALDNHYAKWLRKRVQWAADDRRAMVEAAETALAEAQAMHTENPTEETAKVVSIAEKTLETAKSKMSRGAPTVLVVANKAEGGGSSTNDALVTAYSEATRFGFNDPIMISAHHGEGLSDLAVSLIEEARKRGLREEGTSRRHARAAAKKKLAAAEAALADARALAKAERTNMMASALEVGEQSDDEDEDEGGHSSSGEYDDDEEGDFDWVDEDDGELVGGDEEDWEAGADLPKGLDPEIVAAIRELSRPDPAVEAAMAERDPIVSVAMMGRPNVGKSTLINAMVGSERVIAGPTAGLTRDAVSVEWVHRGRRFRLVDTAGLTRLSPNREALKGVKEGRERALLDTLGVGTNGGKNGPVAGLPGTGMVNPEEDPSQFSAQIAEQSLQSALSALRFASVVVLVVESTAGRFSKTDLQLARRCLDEGRGLIIAANKFDLVAARGVRSSEYAAQVASHTDALFREFGNIPIVTTTGIKGGGIVRDGVISMTDSSLNLLDRLSASTATGGGGSASASGSASGVDRLLATAASVHDAWSRRIPTWVLNRWARDLFVTAPTSRVGGKAVRVKFLTQLRTRPPTFGVFANAMSLPPSMERFIRTRLQREFDFGGVPIRLVVRKTKGSAVKRELLKHGKHSRRGTGAGESRGKVGPRREQTKAMKKVFDITDARRRRDSRNRRKRKA